MVFHISVSYFYALLALIGRCTGRMTIRMYVYLLPAKIVFLTNVIFGLWFHCVLPITGILWFIDVLYLFAPFLRIGISPSFCWFNYNRRFILTLNAIMLFQRRVVSPKLDIYVFITITSWWAIIPQGYHPPRSQCFSATDMILSNYIYILLKFAILQ